MSETLDKLTNFLKRDRRDYAPKDKIELFVKFSEILERLRRLLIIFKRDFISISPILILLRFREKL